MPVDICTRVYALCSCCVLIKVQTGHSKIKMNTGDTRKFFECSFFKGVIQSRSALLSCVNVLGEAPEAKPEQMETHMV